MFFNWMAVVGRRSRKCYGAVKSTVTKMVTLVNGPDVSPVSLLLDQKDIGRKEFAILRFDALTKS